MNKKKRSPPVKKVAQMMHELKKGDLHSVKSDVIVTSQFSKFQNYINVSASIYDNV